MLSYTAQPGENALTVRYIMLNRLFFSVSMTKRLIRTPNALTLNGLPARGTDVLKAGDTLSIVAEDLSGPSPGIIPVPGEVNIAYEDEDVLIVDKQSGITVHPANGHYDDSLANHLAWYYKSLGEDFVFRPLNRLDRGTSGLMAIAKNSYSSCALSRALSYGAISRQYFAVIRGHIDPPEGTIDLPILRDPEGGIRRIVDPKGARAVTRYFTVSMTEHYSLLRVTLETGRTHQIRVHLSHLKHPVVNDFLYGEEIPGFSGQALHCCRLELTHPSTAARLVFESPLPEEWTRLLTEDGA